MTTHHIDENFIEELENVSGLNSKEVLEDTEVLMTSYPNKSSLSPTIGRINVRKALKQLCSLQKHKELLDKGKFIAPIGEIYKDNEIVYYVPLGNQAKKYSKLTQFKDPSLL